MRYGISWEPSQIWNVLHLVSGNPDCQCWEVSEIMVYTRCLLLQYHFLRTLMGHLIQKGQKKKRALLSFICEPLATNLACLYFKRLVPEGWLFEELHDFLWLCDDCCDWLVVSVPAQCKVCSLTGSQLQPTGCHWENKGPGLDCSEYVNN